MIWFVRIAGYWLGMVVTDIAVGLLEERKMRREFSTYSNDNDGTVSAHVVTDETAGTVTQVGGTSRDVGPGDILVATDRSDVFHVADAGSLDGYSEHDQGDDDSEDADVSRETEDGSEDDQGDDDSEDDAPAYDPAERSAIEVRQYLERMRTDGNRAEFERVTSAESAGKNRVSALAGAFDR